LVIGIYVLALVATVVGVDILIFRHNAWARLLANVGIVLLFAAFYLRFQAAFRGQRVRRDGVQGHFSTRDVRASARM
jgi:hypothetical protein